MPVMSIYEIGMVITFVVGYFLITIEHVTKVNKTSIALLSAIICWILQFANQPSARENNLAFLGEHLSNVSQVIFFLMGALVIVEIISVHKGFRIISRFLHVQSKKKLLWLIGGLAFFLSAVLDNLTATIVMVTLLQKLITKGEERLLIGGAIVIAANAGGAWTPIGDVTTTMLWIGGQLSAGEIIHSLFIPSLACLIVSLVCLGWSLKGNFAVQSQAQDEAAEPLSALIFWVGLASLMFVPLFKVLTGLPPYMGMIFGLSLLWLITDLAHHRYDDREHLLVPRIISNIDMSSVLFFMGILLCIDALYTAGLLSRLAQWMNEVIGNLNLIAILIGLISAIVDNVPLVAAAMGMYDISAYPMDSDFWKLVAYCAGTGGSILIIGSAAGVAFMGLERTQFFWYLRRIGVPAFVGYLVGAALFLFLNKS